MVFKASLKRRLSVALASRRPGSQKRRRRFSFVSKASWSVYKASKKRRSEQSVGFFRASDAYRARAGKQSERSGKPKLRPELGNWGCLGGEKRGERGFSDLGFTETFERERQSSLPLWRPAAHPPDPGRLRAITPSSAGLLHSGQAPALLLHLPTPFPSREPRYCSSSPSWSLSSPAQLLLCFGGEGRERFSACSLV
jgi:hypothetical protein